MVPESGALGDGVPGPPALGAQRATSCESRTFLGNLSAELPRPMNLGFVAGQPSLPASGSQPLWSLLSSGLAAMDGPPHTTPAGNGNSQLGSEAPAALDDAEGPEVLAPVCEPAEGEAAQEQ